MKKVTSGIIPHYMIIHTLGSLALANYYGTVPYVKSLLTKMLPIMSMLKFDHHKQAFAYGKLHVTPLILRVSPRNEDSQL